MTLLELLLELLLEFMMIMDIPDWGWCPWWLWVLLELMRIVEVPDGDWLGLVSLMPFWMVCICSEEALFKIWLKSVEFEGIKNPLKDGWHFWSFCWGWWWLWMFLTGVDILDYVSELSISSEEAMFKILLKSVVQRFMTLLQLFLDCIRIMDIPEWELCPWWCYGLSAHALEGLCLKFCWNLLNLKAAITP